MSNYIRLHRRAEAELEEAVDWYRERDVRQGAEFIDAIHSVFMRIAALPGAYPVVFKNGRRAVVPKFPYCVYFVWKAPVVLIASVFHDRRNPRIWQRRV